MKLHRDDQVVVIAGRDKGKTGKVLVVLPKEGKVLVENINVVKRHTKPSQKQPRGGILEIPKPINVSKLMALDPDTGRPARVGYTFSPDGTKERRFKVAHHTGKPKSQKATKSEADKPTDQPTDKPASQKADKPKTAAARKAEGKKS